MVLKLYRNKDSGPCKVVAAVLNEKNISFEFVDLDLWNGDHKSPEYLAKNLFGQVPCIDDNGFILYETRAICRYLDETYSNQENKLIPSDPKKHALMDQAIFTEIYSFERPSHTIIFENFYKKCLFGTGPDVEKVKESSQTLATKLDIYENILSKQKYIAGDEFTLADLFHVPTGISLVQCGVTLIQERPNVARWFNEISSRLSWAKVKDGLVQA